MQYNEFTGVNGSAMILGQFEFSGESLSQAYNVKVLPPKIEISSQNVDVFVKHILLFLNISTIYPKIWMFDPRL